MRVLAFNEMVFWGPYTSAFGYLDPLPAPPLYSLRYPNYTPAKIRRLLAEVH